MTEQFIELIRNDYNLIKYDETPLARARKGRLKVDTYYAEGLGGIAVARYAGAPWRGEIFIVDPCERDLPLYIYARRRSMGRDNLTSELYDTVIGEVSLSSVGEIKSDYAYFPERRGYREDSKRLPESISKRVRSFLFAELDCLAYRYLDAYLHTECAECSPKMREEKLKRSSDIAESLTENGHPASGVLKELLARLASESLKN